MGFIYKIVNKINKMSLSKCKEIIQYDLNNIELNRFIGSKEASQNVNIIYNLIKLLEIYIYKYMNVIYPEIYKYKSIHNHIAL